MFAARSPKFNSDGSVNLFVKFPWIDEEVEFSAYPNDSEQHGRDLYAMAIAGEFGQIAEYVPPVLTDEQLAAKAKSEARAYLAETDWYVTRKMETGEAIPDEVSTKRAEARALL